MSTTLVEETFLKVTGQEDMNISGEEFGCIRYKLVEDNININNLETFKNLVSNLHEKIAVLTAKTRNVKTI